MERIKKALNELQAHTEQKEKNLKKQRKKLSEDEKKKIRASITDPESRIMKLPRSEFAPAYNVQFASDTNNKAIVGVHVINSANDLGQLSQMQEQIKNRFGVYPKEILADPGYLDYDDVEKTAENSDLYIPADKIKENQSEPLLKMKRRMESDAAKEIYKDKSSNS